jgi:crossover junction endodeoxyribonuclease RuvC
VLILGLDPGSVHTGYGFLEKHGSSLRMIEAGRFSCPRGEGVPERLGRLAGWIAELVEARRPDLAALESPFQGLNARSLIVLSQARGALLAHLAHRGIAIREFSPAEVKSAVTGSGRADKQQVARMVRLLLTLEGGAWPTDATDALAVAACCAHRLRLDRVRDRVYGAK